MTATQARATTAGDKLLGTVAFVTGGTRGIGASVCRSLAVQGADVAAGFSGDQQRADEFAREYADDHPDSHMTVHRGDIGSADDCRRCIDEVIEQHGRLGQPGETARVVHFLAADASAYITGQIRGVNGGLDM